MKTRCVLCRTCANSIGRRGAPERRVSARVCAAGLPKADTLFECASYVARPSYKPPTPAAGTNVAPPNL